MTPERQALLRYRLARAREALEEARLLLDGGHANACVNRLYYASFYAVSALLLVEGHSSAKHRGVRALFDRHWVKPGRVPPALGRLYCRLNPLFPGSKLVVMRIELSGSVEEQLRALAARQGRDVGTLAEEAVRQYLEAAAITDLDATEVADAQAALISELSDISAWKADNA